MRRYGEDWLTWRRVEFARPELLPSGSGLEFTATLTQSEKRLSCWERLDLMRGLAVRLLSLEV